ncbi:TPA: hypothetical protein ACGBLG_004528 [Salmonella enterica subsp. enterica serovar Panama]
MKKPVCMFCGAPTTLLCDGIIGWDADEDEHGHMTKCRGMFTCDAPVCRNCATWHGNIFFDGKIRMMEHATFAPCARSYTKPANPYALQTTGKTPLCRNPA